MHLKLVVGVCIAIKCILYVVSTNVWIRRCNKTKYYIIKYKYDESNNSYYTVCPLRSNSIVFIYQVRRGNIDLLNWSWFTRPYIISS